MPLVLCKLAKGFSKRDSIPVAASWVIRGSFVYSSLSLNIHAITELSSSDKNCCNDWTCH